MQYLLLVFPFFAAVMGALAIRKFRQRGPIRREIESTGGIVRSFELSADTRGWSVIFVSGEGDLRHAIARVRRGRVELLDEKPYEEYWEARHSDDPEPLRSILRASKYGEYPGHDQYKLLIRGLADDPRSKIEIRETSGPPGSEEQPRFAAILQCIRRSQPSMSRDALEGILEMMIDDRQLLNVEWRIQGAAPARVLTLSVAPQDSRSAS